MDYCDRVRRPYVLRMQASPLPDKSRNSINARGPARRCDVLDHRPRELPTHMICLGSCSLSAIYSLLSRFAKLSGCRVRMMKSLYCCMEGITGVRALRGVHTMLL